MEINKYYSGYDLNKYNYLPGLNAHQRQNYFMKLKDNSEFFVGRLLQVTGDYSSFHECYSIASMKFVFEFMPEPEKAHKPVDIACDKKLFRIASQEEIVSNMKH